MANFDAAGAMGEITLWIQGFFSGAGGAGEGCPAVVGLSGGKDSSVVAALCARALGAGRVFGVLMPQGEQWDMGVALDVAGFLGIRHSVVNVGGCVDAVFAAMREGGLEPSGQAATNAPARVRLAALYAAAATLGGRVACTCNLSENWVGYSTKFGVGAAGDFSPIAALTSTEVRAVGRALGLPARFVDKEPEDGLSGMTDEENLGFSYGALDALIRGGDCESAALRARIGALRRAGLHKLEPIPRCEPRAAPAIAGP